MAVESFSPHWFWSETKQRQKEKNSTLDEAVSQLKLQKKMKIWHAEGDQFTVPGKWVSMFQASPLETVTALHGYRALTLGGGIDQQVVSNRKSVWTHIPSWLPTLFSASKWLANRGNWMSVFLLLLLVCLGDLPSKSKAGCDVILESSICH